MQNLKKISAKSVNLIILLFTFNFLLLSFNLSANPKGSKKQLLRLQAYNTNTPEYFDETVVYFDSNATPLFNPYYDAFKLMNTAKSYPNVFILAGIDTFSIKALPSLNNQPLIVPIGLKVNYDGVYKLVATEILNFPDNIDIYLIDNLTQTRSNLRSSPSVTFSYNIGLTDGRFTIEFSPKITTSVQSSKTHQNSSNQFLTYIEGNILNLNINPSFISTNSSFISIYNILGQTIINNDKIINTNNSFSLPKGTYFIQIISSDSSKPYTKKIMIK